MTGNSHTFSLIRAIINYFIYRLVLKLASHSASESQKRIHGNNLCEHCPAVWLQRLMVDVEGS